jgi:hypothetical protein
MPESLATLQTFMHKYFHELKFGYYSPSAERMKDFAH